MFCKGTESTMMCHTRGSPDHFDGRVSLYGTVDGAPGAAQAFGTTSACEEDHNPAFYMQLEARGG